MQAWEIGAERIRKIDQLQKAKALFFGAAVSFGLFFVILIVHLATSTRDATTNRSTVVIFSDARDDDLVALNYLLHRSDLYVPLIVAAGSSLGSPSATQRNLERFTAFLSQTAEKNSELRANPPLIAAGSPFALSDRQTHNCSYDFAVPSSLRLSIDSLFGAEALLGSKKPSSMRSRLRSQQQRVTISAAKGLRTVLAKALPASVTIVSFAPLTDVAYALQNMPLEAGKISNIIISGGALSNGDVQDYFPGTGSSIESNFFLDPDAANAVFSQQKIPITIMTRDAAQRASYTSHPKIWQSVSRRDDELNSRPSRTEAKSVNDFIGGMLQGYYESTRPHSLFDARALPLDLVTAIAVPRVVRGQTTVLPEKAEAAVISKANVGVSTKAHVNGDVRRVGILGQLPGKGTVNVVAGAKHGAVLWNDYFLNSGLPWPRV